MIIDSHAHILPATFVEDVRQGIFFPPLSIEPGKIWEFIVIQSTASGENRIFKNALPPETYDVDLRLEHMA